MTGPGARTDGRTDHGTALVLLAACGILWSSAGVLIKLVTWHPLAIWSVRCAIAGATLQLIARPSWRGLTRGEWGAALALAATTGLFILANKLTTAANAILIQYSAPIWVALLGSWFLGERATRLDWITIVVVLAGVGLFFVEQLTIDHQAGNAVALAAGVAFAWSAMSLRKAARDHVIDPRRSIILGNLIGAVVGLPFLILHAGDAPDLTGWAALAALGVFQQAAAYVCYGWAIRHASALEALLIPIIEPILSPIWVWLAFGERPGPWALVGGVVVVGAVTTRALLGRRPA
jgi:drug/metabolite transporter (DMT)-like permease